MIRIALPLRGSAPELLDRLRSEPKAPVLIDVPELWCFRIHRSGPAGGWKSSLLRTLRPALFPVSLDGLHWDEELTEDGAWVVWALDRDRLDKALGPISELLWKPGRRVRVRPAQSGDERVVSFPNLAPMAFRPRRIPWPQIRRWAWRLGPPLAALLILGLAGLRFRQAKLDLDARLSAQEQAVQRMDHQVQADRQVLTLLRGQESRSRQDPPWLLDLDALTRLLPEDTRLVKLDWTPQGVQLDLMTPNPEKIQEILEASPEFKGVRFVGNLDRQGDLSRLTLQLQSEVER